MQTLTAPQLIGRGLHIEALETVLDDVQVDNGRCVLVSGEAGGRLRIGGLTEPSAIIKMDVLEFNRLASDRISAEDARAQGLVTVSGDRSFADRVLAQTSVPY